MGETSNKLSRKVRDSNSSWRCKRERPTDIQSLPDELLSDILVRLPANYIHDVARLVCLRWYHIVRSSSFINSQIQHSTYGLILTYHQVGGVRPFLVTATQDGQIETCELSCRFRTGLYSSCNGLALDYNFKNELLHILNPATKQELVLPSCSRQFPRLYRCCIAYAAASMAYKVILPFEDVGDSIIELSLAILTVGVDESWRKVPVEHLPYKLGKLLLSKRPLTTEGSIHWVIDEMTNVLTLDVETETFTTSIVPLPKAYNQGSYFLSTGRFLSLLFRREDLSWEVWGMRSRDGGWSKVLPGIELGAHKWRLQQLFACGEDRLLRLMPIGWVKYPEVLAIRFTGKVEKNCRTKAGLSRTDQSYASYRAGTELLTDIAKQARHTTHAPRNKELDWAHYRFTERSVMEKDIEDGKFLEFASVHGNLYGTSVEAVEVVSDKGKMHYKILKLSNLEAPETEEQIQKRLRNAKLELDRHENSPGLFDHACLVNDDLRHAMRNLRLLDLTHCVKRPDESVKVSDSRLFKALITESHQVLPKLSTSIKSIEFVEGNTMAPGCVYNMNFVEVFGGDDDCLIFRLANEWYFSTIMFAIGLLCCILGPFYIYEAKIIFSLATPLFIGFVILSAVGYSRRETDMLRIPPGWLLLVFINAVITAVAFIIFVYFKTTTGALKGFMCLNAAIFCSLMIGQPVYDCGIRLWYTIVVYDCGCTIVVYDCGIRLWFADDRTALKGFTCLKTWSIPQSYTTVVYWLSDHHQTKDCGI
ncbi:Guanylate kinase 2 [Orobanche minor]